MDALLEGIFLKDDGTIEASKKRLEESLKRLHAVKISHGWFIPRNNLDEVLSFH
jgi:hypothetical protein